MKNLVYLSIIFFLASCGVQRGSSVDKKLKRDMWKYVGPAPIAKPNYRTAIFLLDEKAYLDSLRNTEMTSSDAQIKLILPIPDIQGQIWDYSITRIYDIGDHVDSSKLGFMAVNVDNNMDIVTLYLVRDKLNLKWMGTANETSMRFYQNDSLGNPQYILTEMLPTKYDNSIPAPRSVD